MYNRHFNGNTTDIEGIRITDYNNLKRCATQQPRKGLSWRSFDVQVPLFLLLFIAWNVPSDDDDDDDDDERFIRPAAAPGVDLCYHGKNTRIGLELLHSHDGSVCLSKVRQRQL